MNKAIILGMFVFGLILLTATNTEAIDNISELSVGAGLTPSSSFYVFDIAYESIMGLFAISGESKARFSIKVAEERLAETEEELRQNKTENIDVLMQDYQKSLAKAQAAAELSENIALIGFVQGKVAKHVSVLEHLKISVSDNVKFGVQTALANSQKASEKLGNNSE